MKNHNILISGASIAGPALAFWLSRYGFHLTIVERACSVRPGGYAVDFRGASLRVLERMGIRSEIERMQTRTGAITIVDSENRKIASMPDGFTSGELEIMRGDLAHILYEHTRRDAEYIFDDSVTSFSPKDDGIEVSFQRSQRRTFDLVIGADGLHSKVRALAFGEESRFLHHLGYYISIFTIPNYMKLDRTGLYHGTVGKKVGIFGRDHETATASFFFDSPILEYDRRDAAQQQKILRDRFANEAWEVPRLLELLEGAPDFYFDSVSQIKMNRWSDGRTALLGDAAWCPSPLSGMGTGMAMVGAYILAGELKQAEGDYTVAFPVYESLMREFTGRCQKLAEGADWFVPRSRWKLWLSTQMWRVLPHTSWKNMMIEIPLKVGNSIILKDY
ncbi:FAD-dependent monooxygenase [Acidobacterium sp. S8]|uniref:FAD-dependent monooxygenase n=1 Tax=Acidobacterium sp. S8 TaxID=1641854 RepID=UPI00131EBBEA|nr:FAD-dependent monooxygenase [Acidobacterium sp. S8]